MSLRKQCEFFLLRYVPDAVKNEFVNIGIVLYEVPGERPASAVAREPDARAQQAIPERSEGSAVAEPSNKAWVRFTRDWRRVRCLDPDADVDVLAAMEDAIRGQLKNGGRGELLRFIEESFSNTVQAAPATACLADDPAQELERLAEMYVETARRERAREASGRQVILGQMDDAFRRHGVWDLLKKNIAVAKYTRSGDPLKLDRGYRPNGVIKLFHAISLASDVNAAKVLAFSYPQIAEGITRVEKAKSELTVVIEPNLDRSDEQIGFALETLERSRIAVATVADMEQIAQRARVELRV